MSVTDVAGIMGHGEESPVCVPYVDHYMAEMAVYVCVVRVRAFDVIPASDTGG